MESIELLKEELITRSGSESKTTKSQKYLQICYSIYETFLNFGYKEKNKKTFFNFIRNHFDNISYQKMVRMLDVIAISEILRKRNLPPLPNASLARKFVPLKRKKSSLLLPKFKERVLETSWLEALGIAKNLNKPVSVIMLEHIVRKYANSDKIIKEKEPKQVKSSLLL